MAEELALSVVLATYCRAEILRETLYHLFDQDLDPAEYEVIVIDDGSTDHTRKVVEEWVTRAPFRLRYLHHANHGPGYTQNRGIEAAEAPVVLLMADDIFMSRQALRAHLEFHRAHPEQEAALLGHVAESRRLQDTVFQRHWDHFRFSAWATQQEMPYYKFWACNVSAKREFMMRHGRFRDQRGRGGPAAHEDVIVGYRLSQAGLRLFYSSEASALHCHPTTFDAARNRRYGQGINFGELLQYAPAPEIPVAYHVLNWRTLPDHFHALFGPRRRYLLPEDRNPVKLLSRHLVRTAMFNGLSVRVLWEPLIEAAERNPAIARLMHPQLYRGVLFYHFVRGCRDGYRMFDRPQAASDRPGPIPG
jgi:glycosyltransferase involved in cell wall biosynthesis